MKKTTWIVLSLCCILMFGISAAGQSPRTDATPDYLLLATNRTGTMQKELDDAARRGFRVVAGLPGDDELILLLERTSQQSAPYSYLLLATQRTSTMQKELNEAGRGGFRFLATATIEKGDEIIAIMERAPDTQHRYEYRLLATHRTSTLQDELNDAGRDGFLLKGTFNRNERMAVMERQSSTN